ncbi:unnamed protein product [Amoebophrya sp. A120]|nr:unnamed protein product [Amoebophrya sp. A120]|eukprot:GSA120T00004650001.1
MYTTALNLQAARSSSSSFDPSPAVLLPTSELLNISSTKNNDYFCEFCLFHLVILSILARSFLTRMLL